MNDVDKMAIEMFGASAIPDSDLEELKLRTTEGEHSPDCNCSICKYEEGFDIGMG